MRNPARYVSLSAQELEEEHRAVSAEIEKLRGLKKVLLDLHRLKAGPIPTGATGATISPPGIESRAGVGG